MPLTPGFEWLLTDHNRTRQQLEDFRALPNSSSVLDEARLAAFREILDELKRHLVCEEQALFPILGRYRTMILLNVEHEDLMQAGELVLEALAGGTAPLQQTVDHFQERLEAHMREEEDGVIPFALQAMAPEEQAWVARQVAELRERMQDPKVLEQLWRREAPRCQRGTMLDHKQLPPRPIHYHTLFSAAKTQVQQLSLQAGQSLAMHWSPQHQWLGVLSGQAVFQHASGEEEPLGEGAWISLEPRYWFSLKAEGPAILLLVKVSL